MLYRNGNLIKNVGKWKRACEYFFLKLYPLGLVKTFAPLQCRLNGRHLWCGVPIIYVHEYFSQYIYYPRTYYYYYYYTTSKGRRNTFVPSSYVLYTYTIGIRDKNIFCVLCLNRVFQILFVENGGEVNHTYCQYNLRNFVRTKYGRPCTHDNYIPMYIIHYT